MALWWKPCRFCEFWGKSMFISEDPLEGKTRRRAFVLSALMQVRCSENYCFFTGFLVLLAAGFLAASRPPIKLSASVELNGN